MKRSTDDVLFHKYHGFRCDQDGPSVRQLPMRVNISGRGAPDGEGARPRAPRRRSQSQRCIFRLLIRECCGLAGKAMLFMEQDTNESVEPESDETGLPWLRTWNRVYLVVIIHFAIWIVLLVALTHFFS